MRSGVAQELWESKCLHPRLAGTHQPLHRHGSDSAQNSLNQRALQHVALALILVSTLILVLATEDAIQQTAQALALPLTLLLTTKGAIKQATETASTAAEKITKTAAAKQASQTIWLLGLHARRLTSQFPRIVGGIEIIAALGFQVLGELAALFRGEPLIRFRR